MRLTLAVGLLALFPQAAGAQTATASDPLAAFDSYVRQAIRDWDVPGLAIAVVKDDSVVFAEGYGVRELGSSAPVTVHTLFGNASTTKAFTSMAVAMLIDDGKLSWDDPVTKHLPGFTMPDPYVTREITIRDLLSHRVGFGDPSYLWYGVDYTFEEMISRLRLAEPASSFRSQYAYNNVSYATAGIITGAVSGTTWDDVVRQRILTPLQMHETVTQGRFLANDADVTSVHHYIDDSLSVIPGVGTLVDGIAPAGAMYSNVLDMSRWLRFLLNDGRSGDRRLVSEDVFREMFRPHTVIRSEDFYPTARLTHPHFTAYGLGWFLQDYRGRFVAFHTGSIDGTVAIVGLVPEEELGVVVFANRDHAELRHALMFRVFDAYLDAPHRDWSSEMRIMYDSLSALRRERAQRREDGRVADTHPSHGLEAYAGTYANPLYGTVEVRVDGSALLLERSPFLIADLEHWHYDVFRTAWRRRWLGKGWISFTLGMDGEVEALEIQGARLEKQRAAKP